MDELLYLVHRFPYPPNKGDKIRSYHLLKHLSQSYRIHLGTFIDDEKDLEYLDRVKALCDETCLVNLRPAFARLRGFYGLISNQPLTLPYYADRQLQEWVNSVLERRPIKNILIFFLRHGAVCERRAQATPRHRLCGYRFGQVEAICGHGTMADELDLWS